MNQKNLYLYNINLFIKECAKFLAKQNIKPFNAEKDYPQEPNELMKFFLGYSYLTHAVNVIYNNRFNKAVSYFNNEWLMKSLLQNYNFPWIGDEGKVQTAVVIMNGFLKTVEASDFYEEYCSRVLAQKEHFLFNNSKMKFLNQDEILGLLKTLICDEIGNYANFQKENFNHIFMKSKYEDLIDLHTKLRRYSYDLISLITQNCKSYFTNDYNANIEIEVTAIQTSNVKIQEAYLGLRQCIMTVLPKQKDVVFPFNAYSSLGNAMFSAPNINFKDCIKLIIKSKDIKAFVDNVKLKGSEFMSVTNWSNKIYFNVGNIILLFINSEQYEENIIKEYEALQLSNQKLDVNLNPNSKH